MKFCHRTSAAHRDASNTKKAPPSPPLPSLVVILTRPLLHVYVHLACTCCNIKPAPPKSCPFQICELMTRHWFRCACPLTKVKTQSPLVNDHIGNTHTRLLKSPLRGIHACITFDLILFNFTQPCLLFCLHDIHTK